MYDTDICKENIDFSRYYEDLKKITFEDVKNINLDWYLFLKYIDIL